MSTCRVEIARQKSIMPNNMTNRMTATNVNSISAWPDRPRFLDIQLFNMLVVAS